MNTSQKVGAPTISITELKELVQAYVNSLRVNVVVPDDGKTNVSSYSHSLSSLRGVCKSEISDDQAIDEYLTEKYQ